jgi:hypothetical protein
MSEFVVLSERDEFASGFVDAVYILCFAYFLCLLNSCSKLLSVNIRSIFVLLFDSMHINAHVGMCCMVLTKHGWPSIVCGTWVLWAVE